jgi:predicted RNA binding protein YcfA (HicA-like mRNA interferase family)
MPKLRRLSGKQVLLIFLQLGFEQVSSKGSHFKLRRTVEGEEQTLVIAIHGTRPIPPGTLHAIYRKGCRFVSEETLKPHFYTD